MARWSMCQVSIWFWMMSAARMDGLATDTTAVKLAGMQYQGSQLDVSYDADHIIVALVSSGSKSLFVNGQPLAFAPVVLPSSSTVVISASQSPSPAPEPTPSPVPEPTPSPVPPAPAPSPPPSPSSSCPKDAREVEVGDRVECLWTSGIQELTIPPSAREYCDYISNGYFGYTWPSSDGDYSCATTARRSSNADTTFCVWEDGLAGVTIPQGSSADCDSLPEGRIGFVLPALLI